MKNEEHKLQVSMVKWFDYQYPRLSKCLFSVPNGGQRHIAVATKLKAEGARSGVSDLILCYKGVTTFIEVKTEKGRISKNQEEFAESMANQGFEYYVVRSLGQFIIVVNNVIQGKSKGIA